MRARGPNADDLRKLHAEATQIVNQKFLITTAAITVFGVLSAQMLSSQANLPGPGAGVGTGGAARQMMLGWAGFLGPALLNVVLLVLLFYSTILAGMLRVITTYLVETGASAWEGDWALYRRGGHLGYTRAQAVVFLVLSLVAGCYPVAFALVRGVRLGPSGAVTTHIAVAVVTLTVIAGLGLAGWPDLERKPDERWRRLFGGGRGETLGGGAA